MGRPLPGDLLVAVVVAFSPAEVVVVGGPLREHRPVAVVIVSGHHTIVPSERHPARDEARPPIGGRASVHVGPERPPQRVVISVRP